APAPTRPTPAWPPPGCSPPRAARATPGPSWPPPAPSSSRPPAGRPGPADSHDLHRRYRGISVGWEVSDMQRTPPRHLAPPQRTRPKARDHLLGGWILALV